MNPKELLSFNIKDAAEFHDELNPALFSDSKLIPEVKQKLITIAKDFTTHLGLTDGIEITDITLSGSNAAYSYTKFSDIDLHLVVDYDKLNNDEVYRELFTAKKNEYNDVHDIKIHDYDVELYVQDENQPHFTLGEYSVLHDKWLSFPKKRRANYDERATYAKSMKLAQLSKAALNSTEYNVVERVINKIKKYRKAGLEIHGEFGPENLSYKWLRNQGLIKQLYTKLNKLKSMELSLYEAVELDFQTTELHRLQLNPYFSKRSDLMNLPERFSPWEKASHMSKMTLSESTEFDEISPLLNKLQSLSETSVTIGQSFSVLDLDIIPYHKEIITSIHPTRTIERIKLHENGQINYVQFTDGSRYPKQTHATYNNKPLFLAYYFTDEKTLYKAETIINLALPESWELSKNMLHECSGYIPSESEKNDPRWKNALTVDIKPTTMQDNAKKLGSKISRDGRPPLIMNNSSTAKYMMKQISETTSAGSVVTVSAPVGSTKKRTKGSIFSGTTTSEKFPNSAAVKETMEEHGAVIMQKQSSIFEGIKTSQVYKKTVNEESSEFQIINKKTEEVHGTYRFEPAAIKALDKMDKKNEFKIIRAPSKDED